MTEVYLGAPESGPREIILPKAVAEHVYAELGEPRPITRPRGRLERMSYCGSLCMMAALSVDRGETTENADLIQAVRKDAQIGKWWAGFTGEPEGSAPTRRIFQAGASLVALGETARLFDEHPAVRTVPAWPQQGGARGLNIPSGQVAAKDLGNLLFDGQSNADEVQLASELYDGTVSLRVSVGAEGILFGSQSAVTASILEREDGSLSLYTAASARYVRYTPGDPALYPRPTRMDRCVLDAVTALTMGIASAGQDTSSWRFGQIPVH